MLWFISGLLSGHIGGMVLVEILSANSRLDEEPVIASALKSEISHSSRDLSHNGTLKIVIFLQNVITVVNLLIDGLLDDREEVNDILVILANDCFSALPGLSRRVLFTHTLVDTHELSISVVASQKRIVTTLNSVKFPQDVVESV